MISRHQFVIRVNCDKHMKGKNELYAALTIDCLSIHFIMVNALSNLKRCNYGFVK